MRELNQNRFLLWTAVLLMAAVLYAGLYFWKIAPLKQDVSLAKDTVKTNEQLLDALTGQAASSGSSTYETTVALQKQLPVKPLQDQVMLNLERAEVVSGSFISTIAFSEGGAVTTEQGGTEEENKETEENAGEQEQADAAAEEVLPDGIQKMSIAMTVQSPSYSEMEDFLSSIQSMKRIVKIDNLIFTGKEEITSIEQSDKPLEYQVTFSVFYAPGLTDLAKEAPAVEAPKGAEKIDPFVKDSAGTDGTGDE